MAFKKKLYKLSPDKVEEQVEYKIQQTKRKQLTIKVTVGSNERNVREQLAHKLSGSHMGLWLLIPEYLRLGAWDLLQGYLVMHLILFRLSWPCRWLTNRLYVSIGSVSEGHCATRGFRW